MKKHLLQICWISILAMASIVSNAQTVTNLYHTNRVFKPIEFTNMGSSITAFEAYTMIHRLTTVVGPTNIIVNTNNTYAREYEAVAWGYSTPGSAWAAVISNKTTYYQTYSSNTYDNAGWIKGTRQAYGDWGAYLWLLQNTVEFKTSPTNYWVSPNNVTSYITKVMVGSIGDYPPMTNVVDVGPTNWASITNYPGTGMATDVVYRGDYTAYYQVINPLLVPDYDHNRVIDGRDRSKAIQNEVFHFWKNDDDDAGDVDGNDIPGDGTADSSDMAVDGTRDLIDWFPVYLDLKPTLEAFEGLGYKYVLATLETNEFNVIFSELKPWESGNYLTDLSNANATVSAVVHTINSNGYQLTTAFLDGIMNDDKGIILVEGRYSTSQPLQLWILDLTNGIVLTKDLPLQISGVEEMYRWINLRHVTGGSETRATDTTEPANYPDSLCNGKQVVFVHGFSSSEEGARGWNAEVFKRLYWSGSRAMYTAVTWFGDETPGILPPGAYYHADVINAFQTASNLASAIAALPGQKYLAAHSLGNMVASSAIVDHGLNPTRYFMIDAAVAMEAYKSSERHANEMVCSTWLAYSNRLWSSEWYNLFDSPDGRHNLTWRGRFGNIAQAINYYSSGEDVLNNNDPPEDLVIPGTEKAWAFQEEVKGGVLPAILIGVDSHGGWGFNSTHYYWVHFPEDTDGITADELRLHSFFKPFYRDDLYATNGSAVASSYEVRSKLLAEALPATSRAMGRNRLNDWGDSRNADLMTLNTGWPRANENWLHSDFKNVAFSYVHQFFEDMVAEGGLQ